MITCIEDQLKRDEALRLVPYQDSVKGDWTAGYGHDLTADGGSIKVITIQQADEWLQEDIAHARAELAQHLSWYTNLPTVYQGVLENLCFNLGIGIAGETGLLAFVNTLSLIKAGRYQDASDELLRSKWATEVGQRAHRLYTQLRTGTWQ